jgi:hypothetical protein
MQAANREMVFTDAKGKVLADKATLSLTKVENAGFGPQIKSGLSIRNVSGKEFNVMLVYEIVEISGQGADLEVCFPSNCNTWDKKGKYYTSSRKVSSKAQNISIDTDFNLTGKANCTAILKLYTTKSTEDVEKAKPEQLLATVTLKFNGNATGIESVQRTAPNADNEVWTVNGVFVGRNISDLNSLPNGLYLVRQNGKTTKVVVGK